MRKQRDPVNNKYFVLLCEEEEKKIAKKRDWFVAVDL